MEKMSDSCDILFELNGSLLKGTNLFRWNDWINPC